MGLGGFPGLKGAKGEMGPSVQGLYALTMSHLHDIHIFDETTDEFYYLLLAVKFNAFSTYEMISNLFFC